MNTAHKESKERNRRARLERQLLAAETAIIIASTNSPGDLPFLKRDYQRIKRLLEENRLQISI